MPDQSDERPAIPLKPRPKVVGDMGQGSREQMFKLHNQPAVQPDAPGGTPEKAS
jgi:hypothetical protein